MPDPQEDDPLVAMTRKAQEDSNRRRRDHEELRNGEEYRAETTRLAKTTNGFLQTLNSCWLFATRDADLTAKSIFLRNLDDMGQAVVVASLALQEGALNSGRRELRFLLELAVQSLFVDQQMVSAPFGQRLEFFKRQVTNRSVVHVKDLDLPLLGDEDGFRKEVTTAWAAASNYVHPTKQQLDERLQWRADGVTLGFETAEHLRTCVNEVFRAASIGVVLTFHAMDRASTGDLLVDGLDQVDMWPFHRYPFIAQIDESFDYKHERKEVLDIVRARRARRLAER